MSGTAFFICSIRREDTDMEMKVIKKALMQGRIRLSVHVMERMEKRGYTKSDLISCIMRGERTRLQPYKQKMCAVIEGYDQDGHPMVIIVGHDFSKRALFTIVTAMPPIDDKFLRVI